MKRRLRPPIVAASLSGFVLGVLLTLLATHSTSSGTTRTLPAATPAAVAVKQPHVYRAVQRIVKRALGPSYPNSAKPRLVSVQLVPPDTLEPATGTPVYHQVRITYRLNDHPLGKAWRLRAAHGDVFRVLKDLYTSGLPISGVTMVGEFPVTKGPRASTHVAMWVTISGSRARVIAWRKLDRTREALLWRNLNGVYVDPRFG